MPIWNNLPDNKHTWAFYYYCKRKGDEVTVIRQPNGTVTLEIFRKGIDLPFGGW